MTEEKITGTDFDEITGVLNESDDRTALAKLADNDLQDMFSVVNVIGKLF